MPVLSSLFKILIVGPRGSGKSSLLCRMVFDSYEDCSIGIGQFYRTNPIPLDGKAVTLLLKEVNVLPTSEKTAGFIVVLDSNNELDYNQLPSILDMVGDKKIIIAINKSDLHYSASFWIEDILKLLGNKKIQVIPVSAKNGENIKQLQEATAKMVVS
jgi:GTPase SAR1 family protein